MNKFLIGWVILLLGFLAIKSIFGIEVAFGLALGAWFVEGFIVEARAEASKRVFRSGKKS